jgi:hypothetical protein
MQYYRKQLTKYKSVLVIQGSLILEQHAEN